MARPRTPSSAGRCPERFAGEIALQRIRPTGSTGAAAFEDEIAFACTAMSEAR